MGLGELKSAVLDRIESNRNEIIGIGETIYATPETGFREFETAAFVMKKLEEWGFEYDHIQEYPGIKLTLDTGREGPGLAIVGELDALICREHPDSDPETGAVHACGHNAQIAAALGALKGLIDADALKHMSGKIHFIAVPAEEYIEIEYRMELRDRGIIKYLGGKPELLRRGYFDDVDLCISIHSTSNPHKTIALGSTLNGCIVKNIRYIGKPSHAGSTPHMGTNALYAANLGLSAINAIRETFREEEYIRVHPIITKGGDIVNVIPGEVCIETFVRGKTLPDMLAAGLRVDRALTGAAMAIGAEVEIEDLPGYLPASYDANLQDIGLGVAKSLVDPDRVGIDVHDTGSTDWGDVSSLMPVLESYVGGISGTAHGSDYQIADPDTAYVLAAKYLAGLAMELMSEDAKKARAVLEDCEPLFESKEAYFKAADQLFRKRVLPEERYADADLEALIESLREQVSL